MKINSLFLKTILFSLIVASCEDPNYPDSVWNENDTRKSLYCSQSKEKYGISQNDTKLSFQVWRSSSGITEPLYVCYYELLNDKMEIVETNSNSISIIKNGPLEGIYNNIVLNRMV